MKLALSDYGLSPGDTVKLYARVEDNDPAGAKGSESSIVMIHVVSQQDMDRMTLEREGLETLESKYAQAARRMEQMADRAKKLQDELSKLDPNSALAEEDQKKLEQLAKDMDAAAGEIEKSADHRLPIDLDKALTGELAKAADSLREAAKQVRAGNGSGLSASRASDQLAQARKTLGDEQKDFNQEAQDPLDHFAAIYPLIEDEGRFIDLAQQQKDLADRMKELETADGKDDPQAKARMRDLQEEQEKTRQDLRDLLDDIQDHAAKLPDDPKLDDLRKTAKVVADAVEKSDALSSMQQAEDALNDFSGSRASAAAHEAATTLASFISRCDGMGDKACKALNFQLKLADKLGNSVEQLLAASGLPSDGKLGSGRGGYAAMRSSLKNVGLYGNVPIVGKESSKSGGGQSDRGIAENDNGQPNPNANDGSNPSGANNASGESDPAVPPEYRQRVGDYFRRVADELEQ
jgi:predicted Zn-dependent protease